MLLGVGIGALSAIVTFILGYQHGWSRGYVRGAESGAAYKIVQERIAKDPTYAQRGAAGD